MTTTKLTKKSYSQAEVAEMEQEARKEAMAAAEFMVLLETEGRCQVGTVLPDGRKHCRRLDTVEPCVYIGDGTREGTLSSLGRICMKHLPMMVAMVKRESPGGNGDEFRA